MTSIYTRSGDRGTTSLVGGHRTPKTSARIEAIGTVDECNSHLGLLISLIGEDPLKKQLQIIQHQLFDLGAMLASQQSGSTKKTGANQKTQPTQKLLKAHDIEALEKYIDELDSTLPPLTGFILPGGSRAIAQAHITRAVCRRAERCTFKVAEKEPVPEAIVQFLNRLSDYLFLVARTLSAHAADHPHEETLWIPSDRRS